MFQSRQARFRFRTLDQLLSRAPEHDAERTPHFQTERFRCEPGGRIVSNKPVRTTSVRQRQGLRFAGVKDA